MAKTMPTLTVKHSKDFKASDLNSHNKRYEKLRTGWLNMGQTQAQVDAMFPVLTLEAVKGKPGFYGKFSGGKGGEWRGPFESEQEAKDVVGEVAYETTFS